MLPRRAPALDFPASELAEIPYHVILGGSAVLEDPEGSPTMRLHTVTRCVVGLAKISVDRRKP